MAAMTDDKYDDTENPLFTLYRHGYEHVFFIPSTCSQEKF
jgi:hypothetical protein